MPDELDVELSGIRNHLKLMKPITAIADKVSSIEEHLESIENLLTEFEELPHGRLLCPACRKNNMNKGCPVCAYTGFIENPEYEDD